MKLYYYIQSFKKILMIWLLLHIQKIMIKYKLNVNTSSFFIMTICHILE